MANQLSSEQRDAVDSNHAAIVVSASAGSGKTEVIACRVERLLLESTNDSFRILAVSYTVKAADELDERLREQIGDVRRVDTGTIHAFAHTLVRQHGTWEGLPTEPEVLYRDEDRVELLGAWLEDLGIRLDPDDVNSALRVIDLARARMTDAPYLPEYREALAHRGALDYPAMLEVASSLLERDWVRAQLSDTYKHLVVDEAQNMTPAQYHLLAMVLGPPPSRINAMIVGDEKQSIVQFAGADPKLIRRFESEYGARRIELTTNFRSAAAIARVADRVAEQLGEVVQLQVASAAPGLVHVDEAANERAEGEATAKWVTDILDAGLPETILAPGESAHVRPEEVAVLGRSAAALRWTSSTLEQAGVDHVVASDARDWMSSRLGQAVVDLIAFRAGPDHRSARAHLETSASAAVDSLDRSPVPGLADAASHSDDTDPAALFSLLAALDVADEAWAQDYDVLQTTWERFLDRTAPPDRTYPGLQLHIARTQRGEPAAPGVRILTVHKSQGREFRAVSIVGLNQGQFPDFRQTTPEEQRAELHCFYVAVTRASRLLRLSRARQRTTRKGPWSTDPSEYLMLAQHAREEQ